MPPPPTCSKNRSPVWACRTSPLWGSKGRSARFGLSPRFGVWRQGRLEATSRWERSRRRRHASAGHPWIRSPRLGSIHGDAMHGRDQTWRSVPFSCDPFDGPLGGDEYAKLSEYERQPFVGLISQGETNES